GLRVFVTCELAAKQRREASIERPLDSHAWRTRRARCPSLLLPIHVQADLLVAVGNRHIAFGRRDDRGLARRGRTELLREIDPDGEDVALHLHLHVLHAPFSWPDSGRSECRPEPLAPSTTRGVARMMHALVDLDRAARRLLPRKSPRALE